MQGTPVRVVAVSSSAHQMDGLDIEDLHFRNRKYGAWKAYGQSKLCNVLFAKELARRWALSANQHAIVTEFDHRGLLIGACITVY